MCSSQDNTCVRKAQQAASQLSNTCLPPCSGFMVTSFIQMDIKENYENIIADELKYYHNYTKWSEFPSTLKGLNTFF